jgi:hypothetical protein
MSTNEIDNAVTQRRTELEAMTIREIGREFQAAFQIAANLAAGKENLIERVLAKFRAELARQA